MERAGERAHRVALKCDQRGIGPVDQLKQSPVRAVALEVDVLDYQREELHLVRGHDEVVLHAAENRENF